jgi:aflatoxin B1 aldehyde reductase
MTFGEEGKEGARVHSSEQCRAILDIFAAHGHTELDTARMYCDGTSEVYLHQLGVTGGPNPHGFQVATKVFPNARAANPTTSDLYTHSAADIARALDDSLAALGTDSVDLYYLHAPDRQVPFEETLGAVQRAYEQRRFRRFGISNFRADEVEEIVRIADAHGWIRPTVYQGLYNAIARNPEPALFPVLRKHNIAYYAYNPLAGGFFTGAFSPKADVQAGSRFDPNRVQGRNYRNRYWHDEYFQALEALRPVAEQNNLSLAEIALRWIMHHSFLTTDHGDAVLIGASSINHIEQNLIDMEKGPLPQHVLDAVDNAWQIAKPSAPAYSH